MNPSKITFTDKEIKYIYSIGFRDCMAYILAVNYENIKLPKIAEEYLEKFKEKHFSHDWHING